MEAAFLTRPFRDPSGQVHLAGERLVIVGHVNDAIRGYCWRAKFANDVPVMFTDDDDALRVEKGPLFEEQ